MKPDPSEDDSLIIVLKNRFKAALQDKFVVTPLHVIASFISPAFRSHQFSVKEIRDQAMSDIQKLVMEQDESDNEANIQEEHMPDSILSLYMDKPSSTISSDSEINRYKVFPITPDDIKMSPIDFWYRNRRAFPRLYRIASRLLAAPATNNSSERVFSAAGNIITPHRNRIQSEIVDRLICIRSNYDLL